LIASRDHYVSIGPATDSTLSITVLDVANGDAVPIGDLPAGEMFIASIVTDGTGVIGGVTYINRQKTVATSFNDGELRLRYTGSGGTALEPYDFNGGASLGSRASFDSTEALGGNFWEHIYVEQVEIRSYTDAGHTNDRSRTFTGRISTVGATTGVINVIDLDDVPNGSVVEIQATVVGYSTTNSHVYTRSFAQLARRNNGGTMGLVGSLVETRTEYDSGALSLGSTLIASAEGDNSLIQVQVTGAAANTIQWTVRIATVEKRGA
jgi:hypothetical protein